MQLIGKVLIKEGNKVKYSSARTLLGLMVVAGWAVIIIGGLGSAVIYSTSGAVVVLLVGLMVSGASGLLLIAQAQIGLALLDTAENSAGILLHLQGRSSVSPIQSGAPYSGRNVHVPLTARHQSSGVGRSEVIKHYKGYEFIRTAEGVRVGNAEFDGVLAAEKWVNSQPVK